MGYNIEELLTLADKFAQKGDSFKEERQYIPQKPGPIDKQIANTLQRVRGELNALSVLISQSQLPYANAGDLFENVVRELNDVATYIARVQNSPAESGANLPRHYKYYSGK